MVKVECPKSRSETFPDARLLLSWVISAAGSVQVAVYCTEGQEGGPDFALSATAQYWAVADKGGPRGRSRHRLATAQGSRATARLAAGQLARKAKMGPLKTGEVVEPRWI